jgi:single-stranded DNA-binding protein
MNHCILMAEITQEPQLRYTSDSQTPIVEMWVQFEGLREDDPPATLRVIGWGNLAQEIQETYHQGDRVIIEGRLHMNTIDRSEGFKEKHAELTVQRIHKIGSEAAISTASATTLDTAPDQQPPAPSTMPKAPPKSASESTKSPTYTVPPGEPVDYDEIPF